MPVALVVKNGSKTCARASSAMPAPVSLNDEPDEPPRPRRRDSRRQISSPTSTSAGLDDQAAAVGHRVARVDRQVDDHLLELAGVGPDAAESGARGRVSSVDVLADDAPQHPLHVGDQRVQVDGPSAR